MDRWLDFQTCPGCSYDFATGDGEMSCDYGECPYLPEALKVMCPQCMYDFITDEGNPSCVDPATCEHGADARANVENVLRWKEHLAASTA